MTKILNERQERFAVLIAEGNSPSESYVGAGYSGAGSAQTIAKDASRLQQHKGIAARIAAIRATVAEAAGITASGHAEALEALRDNAASRGQLSAAVAAETHRGRLAGLYAKPVKPEPTEQTQTRQTDSDFTRRWIEAQDCLEHDELDAMSEAMGKVRAEMDRVAAGGRAITREEREARPVGASRSSNATECKTCGLWPLHDELAATMSARLIMQGHRHPHEPATPLQSCPACGLIPLAGHPDCPLALQMGYEDRSRGILSIPLNRHAVKPQAVTDHMMVIFDRGKPHDPTWHHKASAMQAGPKWPRGASEVAQLLGVDTGGFRGM